MTPLHKAAQMALDALDAITDDVDGTGLNTMPSFDKALDAIAALREALNAPEPEPYGHVTTHTVTGQQFFYRYPSPPYLDTAKECIAVYAAPPAAQEPVALESVHLTRDTKGMCVVRVNGRIAIRDNGDIIDHMATLEWFAAPPGAPASQWMPIETAPKDGTPVLLLTNERWKDCRPGTQFVGINRGNLSEWCFYAPVGMGGIPDAWLDGWMPLPAAPGHFRDVAEKVAPAAPLPDGLATNADEVICPNCAHQFRAIPENVQSLLLASGHEPPFTASPAAPAAPVVREPDPDTHKCSLCGVIGWHKCGGILQAHGITGGKP